MKRVLMVLALVLVMAASAAPAALAANRFNFCYASSDPDLGVLVHCLPSKKACEQARANDPMATSGECINRNKISR